MNHGKAVVKRWSNPPSLSARESGHYTGIAPERGDSSVRFGMPFNHRFHHFQNFFAAASGGSGGNRLENPFGLARWPA